MDNLFTTQQKILACLREEIPLDEKLLKKHQVLSAEERIAIYRESSIAGLIKTLRQTYKICVNIVGDEFFNAMARIYIKKTPSHHPNINDYGETFPHFIATFPHTQPLPYLPDVALLEWLWHKAFYAEHTPHFDPNILSALSEDDYPNIVFSLPASAGLMVSDYPLGDIWALHQEGYQGSETVSLDKGGVKLLIWRKDMQVCMEALQEDEWLLLNAIQQGGSLGELMDRFVAYKKEEHLPNLLPDFITKGWIAGYMAWC